MPPGGRLAASVGELLWGRSYKAHQPLKTAERQLASNVRTKATQSIPRHQPAVGHAAPARNAGGKFVNLLVDTFSPLLRSPGQVGKQHRLHHQASPPSFGHATARAALHTSARRSPGFGAVRPKAVPRSTNTMGLQSARNFSSSRPVFDNIVANAPLGLRVLGDKDRLDMRNIRREAKVAHLRKIKESRKNRAKSMANLSRTMTASFPAAMERYFPSVQAPAPCVQLVLPLNPVSDSAAFLSYREEADDSRFFSAMLMSDLRLLSEMHGTHHSRLENVIQNLEVAGCFEEQDERTGQPSVVAELGELEQQLLVNFYGDRWSVADVKQAIGCYDDKSTWYQINELGASPASCLSEVDATISELPSSGVSNLPSPATSFHSDEQAEYFRVSESLRIPSGESLGSDSSYLWGVEDFLYELDSVQAPTFKRAQSF